MTSPSIFSTNGSDGDGDGEEDDRCDALGLLAYLHRTTSNDVRVYLINRFHDLPLEHIEFVMPQLCCLYMVWPDTSPVELVATLLVNQCMKSMHFGLKIVWLLHAEIGHTASHEQQRRQRCNQLLERCEAAIVNGPPLPDTDDEQVLLAWGLSKQQRSEYFNAQVNFLDSLEQISCHLVKVPSRKQRMVHLRKYLKHLTDYVAFGLYIPLGTCSSVHYRILRIPEQDASALDSRDKAPFMMTLEVATTPGRVCGSQDIYKLFAEMLEDESTTTTTTTTTDANTTAASASSSNKQSTPVVHVQEVQALHQSPHIHSRSKSEESETVLLSSVQLTDSLEDSYFDRTLTPQIEVETLHVASTRGHGDASTSRIYDGLEDTVWVSVSPEELDFITDPRAAYNHSPDDDPVATRVRTSRNLFRSTWHQRCETSKRESLATKLLLPGEQYELRSVIFKGGDDLRQEALAMQIIVLLDQIFRDAHLPLRLQPFHMLITSAESGVIGTVPDAHSIHRIKKAVHNFKSLATFFVDTFGDDFVDAQRVFIESMAAYSVLCYLLQVKDRHNGNILLDRHGAIIHIDFGFMLSNSPGGNFNFESSPFKLTREYVEVMGGEESQEFAYFRMLVLRGFLEARKHVNAIVSLVDIVYQSGASMSCFAGGAAAITALRDRMMVQQSEQTVVEAVMALIDESVDNWRSVEYDTYQRMTNGIL